MSNGSYVTDSSGSWLSQFMATAGNGLINSLTTSITEYEDISAEQSAAGTVYTQSETDTNDIYSAEITTESAKSSPDTTNISNWSQYETNWNSYAGGMASTTSTESQASAAVGTAESALITELATEIGDVISSIAITLTTA
jgi:hypothetical protein